MNQLLYGHNADERIVAVHHLDDGTMRMYVREAEGIRTSDQPFYPFFFLADANTIEGFKRKHWLKRLDGSGYFQFLCVFEEWPILWDAIRYVMDRYNRAALTKVDSYAELEIVYLPTDPVTQFLMQSGRTLFKGMAFEEIHRLQLDIETYTTPPHRFSNASRETDRIILIALSDNRGWERLIDGRKLSESEMLTELVKTIAERDPDVIEGHNIFNFDLPYILTRCALHNIVPALGRDGGVPRSFDSRMSFAEQSFEYTVAEIPGRQVIDTLLLVQSYDASKRNMESYGLKYAARYFGFASEGRTYIEGDKISWYWDHDPKALGEYAMDDVRETRMLSEHLSGTSFYLTQMLPGNYGAVARSGSAAKIEQLLVREYLRQKHALPRPQEGMQTTGGYTDIYLTGVVGPVVHADVESLYPSIMITKRIAPATDVKGIFLQLLTELTTSRLAAKRRMRAMKPGVGRSRLDAMQSSLKILINSFYGYLGYSRALFNDYHFADVVTQTGQQLLRQMIGQIVTRGGSVIEVDTDGIFFVPPAVISSEEDERQFIEALSDQMPEGIVVAMDGRYKKMLSYKKKNYALQEYGGEIRIKGSSLISRSMEQFGRQFVRECIEALLREDIAGLHATYLKYHEAIVEHKLRVTDFARVEALKDPITRYIEEVDAGQRNKSAAYEVARTLGRQVKPGDRIAYYITGSDPNVRGFENCRAAGEWNPNFPDENVLFYLRRLDEFSEKFSDFFRPADFQGIFSAESLFPFDPTGISSLVSEVSSPEQGGPEEPPSQQFGIWLDE